MKKQGTLKVWTHHTGSILRVGQHHGNSNVKLKIPYDGTKVEIISGGPTDEGYSYESLFYQWDDENQMLVRECYHDASDCDGRETGGQKQFVKLIDIITQSLHDVDDPEAFYPPWESYEKWHRDHQAEKAGY